MLEPGLIVGKYQLARPLGRGSYGVVFEARDRALNRTVALKFLLPEHGDEPGLLKRFLQEARAAAKVNHPGIVTIHECGFVEDVDSPARGNAFIAMEYLHGEALSARMSRGPLPLGDAIEILEQLAAALQAAHDAGIVHRDLKPDNIFIVPDPAVGTGERIKVLDFGIAKLNQLDGSSIKTGTMVVLGTPRYMSPEQCRSSARVDHRADIYALGCIAFEMVAGEPVFHGDIGELIAFHQMKKPRRLAAVAPAAAGTFDRLIDLMLAKDPARRPESMAQIARILGGHEPVPSPRSPEELALTTLGSASVHRKRPRGRRLAIAIAGAILVGGGAGVAIRGQTTAGSGVPALPRASPRIEPLAMPSADAAVVEALDVSPVVIESKPVARPPSKRAAPKRATGSAARKPCPTNDPICAFSGDP